MSRSSIEKDYTRRADFSKAFYDDLFPNGKWSKLITYANETANKDLLEEQLDVHLRGNDCIHIYYKGGKILEITSNKLHLDSNYFYLRKEHEGIYRTWMERKAKGKVPESTKEASAMKGITPEEAKNVFHVLEERRDELIGPKPYVHSAEHPDDYFSAAKEVMNKWNQALQEEDNVSHQERLLQQKISLTNKDPNNEFVVVDIEFAVSENAPFRSCRYKHPRFDIIAVHKQPNGTYELAVIELKKGLKSTGLKDDGSFDEKMSSGVRDHIEKFNATVGGEYYPAFLEEVRGVIRKKVKLGILPQMENIEIADTKPKFYLAYAGKDMDSFKSACEKIGQKCICIPDENNPVLKL